MYTCADTQQSIKIVKAYLSWNDYAAIIQGGGEIVFSKQIVSQTDYT